MSSNTTGESLWPVLATLTDRKFLVAGHTDNVPMEDPHGINLALSLARAQEVAKVIAAVVDFGDFLEVQAGHARNIVVGFGRDYADVPPLRGIIYTDSESSIIDVSVDVAPLAGGPLSA